MIRRVSREIDTKCCLVADGDDTYPAECGKETVDKVSRNNSGMVVGDRLSSTYSEENRGPFHNLGNSLVRSTTNCLFKMNVCDIMTGYRALSYLFVETLLVLSKGFEIEMGVTIYAVDKNMMVGHVIIEYRDRVEGNGSKLDTYSDGFKVLKSILRLYKNYHPMKFFGGLSMCLFVIAALMFSPILLRFFGTGLAPNFPMLVISEFAALTAIISRFSGMIFISIVEKDRQ